mgnify:FL=1
MSSTLYYVLTAILSVGVLFGIKLMSQVKTAAWGNRLSALCMLAAIVITMINTETLSAALGYIIAGLLIGTLLSIFMTVKVKMIQMPQMVGLLNGLGGLASAVAAILTIIDKPVIGTFELVTAGLALAVGGLTFSGSMVAAGKLHGMLPQKPKVYPGHQIISLALVLVMLLCIVLLPIIPAQSVLLVIVLALAGLAFGWVFAIRVGGADMPITISLLNSTSGVAAAIAGMALSDVLLVAVGGIVGASGLLLTQIMCRAMNRHLSGILFGHSAKPAAPTVTKPAAPATAKSTAPATAKSASPATEKAQPSPTDPAAEAEQEEPAEAEETAEEAPAAVSVPTLDDADQWIREAKSVIIIPGYGMAISQAQEKVKDLLDRLKAGGKKVRFAIHPVAGRMPGHMNVLLAEVDVPYELLMEMDEINPDFAHTDLVIVIGANDVINPAAGTAAGTPIYGMPILQAGDAKNIIICNYDKKPGYAGVENPLYEESANVLLLLGDAKDSLDKLLAML